MCHAVQARATAVEPPFTVQTAHLKDVFPPEQVSHSFVSDGLQQGSFEEGFVPSLSLFATSSGDQVFQELARSDVMSRSHICLA